MLFVDPDELEVKTWLLSLQNLASQDANGIFFDIKTTFSKKDLRETGKCNIIGIRWRIKEYRITGLKNSPIKLFRDEMPWVALFLILFR